MYCIACGQELPDDAKFCKKCGAGVAGLAAPVPNDDPPQENEAAASAPTLAEMAASKHKYVQHHEPAPGIQPAWRAEPRSEVRSGWGMMVCPHCQTRGRVTTKTVKTKTGISGAKATGAVLTAGFSVLATGLSRKQKMTEAHCSACGATWHFS